MKLALFPLQTVLFPGGLLSLKVFEARYLDLVSACMRSAAPFGVVCLQQGPEAGASPKGVRVEAVGTLARIGGHRPVSRAGQAQGMTSVVAGLACDREDFEGESTRNSVEGVLATQYSFFVNDTPKRSIDAALAVFPSLTESGRVRAEADVDWRIELVEDLFFDMSHYGSYDNKADASATSNYDYGVVTSLGYSSRAARGRERPWRDIAFGGFQHETNTFSPVAATLGDFEAPDAWPGLVRGPALIDAVRGMNLPAAGFVSRSARSATGLRWMGRSTRRAMAARAASTSAPTACWECRRATTAMARRAQ